MWTYEIGSHTYSHLLLFNSNPEIFAADLSRSIEILCDITGERPVSFRAPRFSVTKGNNKWVYKVLAGQGILYSSSVFPIRHPKYGIQDSPRFRYEVNVHGKKVIEFPLSTLRIGNFNLPFGGGSYLRFLPYKFTQKAIEKINREGEPAIVFLHPYEFSPERSKPINGNFRTRLKFNIKRFEQNINRGATEKKLRFLLNDFNFAPLRDVCAGL